MRDASRWMLFPLLAGSLAALLAGCSGAPERELLGTWVLDLEAYRERPEFKAAETAEREEMLEVWRGLGVELTFADEVVRLRTTLGGVAHMREYRWRVVGREGGRLVLEWRDEAGETERVEAELRGGGRLRLARGEQDFDLRRG